MRTRHLLTMAVAVILFAAGLHAQTTQTQNAAGATEVVAEQVTGDVVIVDGNRLFARMPSGMYRFFNVPPGREFIIDGQKRMIHDLKPGTSLTAAVITRTQPVIVRTMSVLNGTVW